MAVQVIASNCTFQNSFLILAKSCENHASCKGIQGTSCVPEPRDPMKMSCLCGDNTTPRNGKCESAVEKGK